VRVVPLFLGLSAANLLCLLITAALGYGVSSGRRDWATYHQLAGALATLVCCGVHCVVFTYFMATAKWVQHAIAVKQLDKSLAAPTRSFKAQAFPAALLAMASVCAAAFVGAAAVGYGLRPIWHHSVAIVGLLINVVVTFVEFRAIRRNGRLIDGVLVAANADRRRVAAPSPQR
jgi:hypothetical protein